MPNHDHSGAQYLTKGWQMIRRPGIRRFVLIPLVINLVLLIAASGYLLMKLDDWQQRIYKGSWEWVQWLLDVLGWLIWPLLIILVMLSVFYLFALLANWIAAPFNGLLAEKVEQTLNPDSNHKSMGASAVVKDIPRTLAREWTKFAYWLPRALIILILFFIPFVNLVAPLIWLLFSAWMMAIQYIDYPMDNNRQPFNDVIDQLKTRKRLSLSFGATILLFTSIPIVNLLIMPVAVAGATILYCEQNLKIAR